MHINKPQEDFQNTTQACEALELIISQPLPADVAPCTNCESHIPNMCNSACVNAPSALSSDPINHPIEQKVVPLVYEITSVRVMQPCWSCEGHFNPDGKLWKLPQINFYSLSPIYPQLLLMHINELKLNKKLTYEWHIVLANFGQSWHISYSIEPNLNQVSDPHLGALQNDLTVIAEDLNKNIKILAKKMLEDIKMKKQS